LGTDVFTKLIQLNCIIMEEINYIFEYTY